MELRQEIERLVKAARVLRDTDKITAGAVQPLPVPQTQSTATQTVPGN